MSSDTKIIVTFNEFGKTVGEEGNELTQFLGTLVRMANHVGIQYDAWRKVPKHKKKDMYSIVKATKNNGAYPTRGEMSRITHTRKDGSIVNDNAAQIVSSLQAVTSDSTNTQGTEGDYTNDDYFKVKGPEKPGYIRCVGRMPAVKDNVASCSTDPQTMQQLKDGLARTQNALSILVNLVKDHIPNANLSGVLDNLNLQVPDNLSIELR